MACRWVRAQCADTRIMLASPYLVGYLIVDSLPVASATPWLAPPPFPAARCALSKAQGGSTQLQPAPTTHCRHPIRCKSYVRATFPATKHRIPQHNEVLPPISHQLGRQLPATPAARCRPRPGAGRPARAQCAAKELGANNILNVPSLAPHILKHKQQSTYSSAPATHARRWLPPERRACPATQPAGPVNDATASQQISARAIGPEAIHARHTGPAPWWAPANPQTSGRARATCQNNDRERALR